MSHHHKLHARLNQMSRDPSVDVDTLNRATEKLAEVQAAAPEKSIDEHAEIMNQWLDEQQLGMAPADASAELGEADESGLEREDEAEEAIDYSANSEPMLEQGDLSREEFLQSLIEQFHDYNGLDKRTQAVGLLSTISQGCGMMAAMLSGKIPNRSFNMNPIPGLFYQFQALERLFPTTVDEVVHSMVEMVSMYYLNADDVEKAKGEYITKGVTVVGRPVATIDGEQRYVLVMTHQFLEEGETSTLEVGQLMWYYDPSKHPEGIDESDWNPFFVAPQEPSNDADLDAALDNPPETASTMGLVGTVGAPEGQRLN